MKKFILDEDNKKLSYTNILYETSITLTEDGKYSWSVLLIPDDYSLENIGTASCYNELSDSISIYVDSVEIPEELLNKLEIYNYG